jgi:Peptidase A4 family
VNITRPRVRGRVAGLAAALALAAGGAAAVAAGTASHAAAAPAARTAGTHYSARAVEAKASLLQYLKKNKAGNMPAPSGGGPHNVTPSTTNISAGSKGTATVGSYNWSGYADTSSTPGTFTAVSGSWVQPATSCTAEQRLTAFWVGLDGYSTDTVEQDGTLAYCFEGRAYYYSWWEMYPGASVFVGSTIRPGDLISASVTRSGSSYTLSLTDHTTPGNSFTTRQTCATSTCLDESAEWIAERPAFEIGITPLSTFSPWVPFSASETAKGVTGTISSGPGANRILMVDATDTYQLDNVSGLNSAGNGFTALWLNSY